MAVCRLAEPHLGHKVVLGSTIRRQKGSQEEKEEQGKREIRKIIDFSGNIRIRIQFNFNRRKLLKHTMLLLPISLPNLAYSVCGPHRVSVGYLKEVALIKGNSAANG